MALSSPRPVAPWSRSQLLPQLAQDPGSQPDAVRCHPAAGQVHSFPRRSQPWALAPAYPGCCAGCLELCWLPACRPAAASAHPSGPAACPVPPSDTAVAGDLSPLWGLPAPFAAVWDQSKWLNKYRTAVQVGSSSAEVSSSCLPPACRSTRGAAVAAANVAVLSLRLSSSPAANAWWSVHVALAPPASGCFCCRRR